MAKDQTEKEYFPSDIHKVGQELGKIYRDQTEKECKNPRCFSGVLVGVGINQKATPCPDCQKDQSV